MSEIEISFQKKGLFLQTARYIFVNLKSFFGKKNPEDIEEKGKSIDIEVQIVSKFKWTFF